MSDPETRVEYARPILDRHESAASEADIRSAVRDFLIQTGLVSAGGYRVECACQTRLKQVSSDERRFPMLSKQFVIRRKLVGQRDWHALIGDEGSPDECVVTLPELR